MFSAGQLLDLPLIAGIKADWAIDGAVTALVGEIGLGRQQPAKA